MKTLLKSLLTFSLVIIFAQTAYAEICDYSPTVPHVTSSELADCSASGSQGQNCRPYGWWYKGQCTEESVIMSDANTCYGQSRKFDGSAGCTTQCTAPGMCLNGTSCITATDPLGCVANFHRNLNCDGTCGSKIDGYEYCSTTIGATGCSPSNPDYGFVCQTKLCTTPGKQTSNYCTGSCTSCTGDYVDYNGNCVLPTDVVYDNDFFGWTGGSWVNFLTVDNWATQILDELITLLTSNETFIEQLTTNETFITNITASLGEFVGITPIATYTGAQSGYKLANDICFLGTGVLEGSHICSPSEIIRSYENGVTAITSQAGIAWFNTGSPSNFVPLVSDCKGWSDGTSSYFGNVWNFNIDAGGVQGCNSQKAFACCK